MIIVIIKFNTNNIGNKISSILFFYHVLFSEQAFTHIFNPETFPQGKKNRETERYHL